MKVSDYHMNNWSPELDRQDELKRQAIKEKCKKHGHHWHTPGPYGDQPTRCWNCGIVRDGR